MLSLFIAQVDEKGKEMNVLGGIELNLVDFVSIKGQMRQQYSIECSKAVWGAAGTLPKLSLTVGIAGGGTDVVGVSPVPSAAAAAAAAVSLARLTPVEEMPTSLSTTSSDDDDDDDVENVETVEIGVGNGDYQVQAEEESGALPPMTAFDTVLKASPQPFEYDSEGFIVDSELSRASKTSTAVNGGGGGAAVSPLASQSTDTGVVKRNLRHDMDAVNGIDTTAAAAAAAAAGSSSSSAVLGGGGRKEASPSSSVHASPLQIEDDEDNGGGAQYDGLPEQYVGKNNNFL